MKRFVEGVDRGQSTLLPECLDDFIDEDNPVRVVDVFVDELDLALQDRGQRTDPAALWDVCPPVLRHQGSLHFRYCPFEIA
jgi:hypothetical protein